MRKGETGTHTGGGFRTAGHEGFSDPPQAGSQPPGAKRSFPWPPGAQNCVMISPFTHFLPRTPRALGVSFLTAWYCLACATNTAPAQPSNLPSSPKPEEVSELRRVLSPSVPGYTVAAAGLSSTLRPLECIEPTAPCATQQNRLVIVAGLDAKSESTAAVHEFVRWWFGDSAAVYRQKWQVAVLPRALPDGVPASGVVFPPQKGFFNDAQSPELRYLWRWCAVSAPDLVVDVRAGDAPHQFANAQAKVFFPAAADAESTELAGALGSGTPSGYEPVAALRVQGPHDSLTSALRDIVARSFPHSPLRGTYDKRAARAPLDIARALAARYPAAPGMSYIPALAWTGALRLSAMTGEGAYRERALAQMQPFLAGDKNAPVKATGLTSLAGHLALSDLGANEANADAAALARRAADALLLPEDSPQIVPGATRWTDDMFMASAVLSRVAGTTGEEKYASVVRRLLTHYASRLQRPDGVFIHVESSPFAWGRGNGFAAFGLMEALTYLPSKGQGNEALLAVYRKHMQGLLAHQSPDGTWRQVIDQPGAYREFTATAMITTAMARGVRKGWLPAEDFVSAIERGWHALSVRISETGALVDVCTGTGAKKDCDVSYYLQRDAIFGPDDRGGAMALTAALEMHELRSK